MNTQTQSWVSMIRGITRLIAILSCVMFVFGTSASVALAATGVPRIMNYQGRLMNSSGTLLGGTGTDYCVKFALYDNVTVGAGSKLWPTAAPSTMTVSVRNGIFNAGVGDTNAGGDTLDFNFEDNDAVYLNVEVATKVGATCAPGDGAESFENLSPRQRVTASGYAINSATLGGRNGAYYLANSFSTSSAAAYVNASSTIAKTYANNTFIGVNAFADITVTNATLASTTLTNASSTNLNVGGTFTGAGLTSCSGTNDKLVWNAATRQFECGTDLSGGGGGADGNWTFFNNSGVRPATTSNQVLVGGTATTSLAKFEVQNGAKFDNATSTTLNTTVFGLGGTEYFTSLAGAGLQNSGGVLTLNTSGDWTGTLDGREGAYYLANSFSTTSAQYFNSVNPGSSFSTTSADYWKSQNNFHSTSSLAYDLSTYDKGYFFSTTSVAFWDSTQFRWATTSSDAWLATKSTSNLAEGTNLYYTPSRVAGVIAGTTTDALAQGSINRYYDDSLVNSFIAGSTSIAKTFANNSFIGVNSFANITMVGATSTSIFSNLFSSLSASFGSFTSTSTTATSTINGPLSIGVANPSYRVSVMGQATGPTSATGTAVFAISNDNNTLSSGNNVLRLNIRTPYATACTSGTTCPRFIEYFAGVGAGSDTGGRGVGSLRLSTAGTGITQTSGAADFAEFMQLSESAAVGDVVSLNSSGEYRKATAGEALIGVVSDNAAFVGNGSLEGEPNAYIIGFAGVIRTTVSDANGDINAGDLIAASDVAGVGVKLSESGYALGQALQSFSGPGVGTISVLVMPKFVDASIALESYGGGASGDSGYWTLSTSTNTVSLASSTNSVMIQGNASTSNLVVSNGFTFGKATGVLKSVAGVVSSSLLNLASDVTGVLGISNGGTGTSTAPTYGKVLVGNNAGGYDLVATSSLGISSGSLVWGSITGTLSAQTDLQNALDLKFGLSQWYATTTDALAEGAINKYYADARVQTYLNGVNKGFFFSTTSASNFASAGLAFSTTSASYFLSQNQANGFSTSSAEYYVGASTTIPKTFTNNTYTGTNSFQNVTATGATTTSSYTGTASSTSLFSNIATIGSLIAGAFTGNTVSATNATTTTLYTGTASTTNINTNTASAGSATIGTLSLGNALSGTSGGTGLNSVSQNALLIGGPGNTWTQVSTSSLGLVAFGDLGAYMGLAQWYATTTDALAEGSTNRYFTVNRVAAALSATTTDAIAEGSTNRYYQDSRVQTYLNGIDKGFFFSSTSASSFAAAGLAFSTTSAAYFNSQNPGESYSTSSADYWKTQRNFHSTSSFAYDLSTYDNGYFFSSTSVAFWDSTQFRWATTSSNAWLATKSTSDLAEGSNQYYTPTRVASVIAGTTTDALAEGATNKYYSNGLVNTFVGASSTIAKTFTNNTFTGVNTFGNISATGATTTSLSTAIASTTNLTISGIQSSMLYTGAGGIVQGVSVSGPVQFSAGTLSVQQADSSTSGYLGSSDFGSFNSRLSTSSLGLVDKGFFFSTTSSDFWKTQSSFFSTSSTDYWKTQNNFFSTTSASHFSSLGLAFSTTSTAYFLGQNQGNAFSTTSANYFVENTVALPKTNTNNTYTGTNAFANITATNATTTTLFTTFSSSTETRANTASFGNATIGSLTTTATSTGSNGFDITDGCYSIDGVCISSGPGGGGGSGELIAIQTFSAVGTTTYTPSAGATSAQVIVTGGGGGGGGADSDGTTVEVPAGGAGAGATAFLHVDLTATTSVQVVVGAGGTGGTAAAGGTGLGGGHSSFGPALGRAGGGSGGVGAVSADTVAGPRTLAGGVGGSATAGDVQVAGGNGQDGNSQVGNTAFGGVGGSSYWGGGGDGGSVVVTATQSAGSNATTYGAGGGGAALADTATGAAGGNGASGIVVVYEYGPFQGTMAVTNGGTGLSSGPSYGQLLMGDGAGGYVLVATSSIGLATTTDSLVEGVQNLYYTESRVNEFVGASTTVAKSFTANIFTALQTFANAMFGNATSTNFAATGVASSSNLVASNSFTFGKVTGILKATAGSVVAALVDLANDVTGVLGISNGGTGTSTAPTRGQLLVGDGLGGYDLVATTTLGIYISDTVGTLDETRGGTGNTSYTAGDILYALNGTTLVPLPAGGNGAVLKIAGGLPAWGADLQGGGGGGGGGGFFSTTTDDLAIYPSDPNYAVIVGNSATTTDDAMLEVFGKSYFSNRMGIATSAPGSIFSIGNVANFSTLGSTMYTKLNLIDVQATGASTFANVLAASLAATDVGASSLSAGTTATTTIQGDVAGTSTIQGFINVTGTNSTSTFSGNVQANGNLQALSIRLTSTSSAAGFNMESGCYAINGVCTVNSLTATNTTLTVSPGSGAVGISLNLSNPNVWSGLQQFGNASSSLMEATQFYARTIQSTSTNALVLQSNFSSTAGLTFGSTSTPQVLGIDTINNRVTLGTGGGTPTWLVLDTKNTPGDPSSGVNGAMYYNSNTAAFRCYNGSWVTCGGQAASSTGDVQFRNVDGSFTATSNFNWSLSANRLALTAAANQATDIFTISSSTGETLFSVGNTGVLNLATTTDQATPTSGLDIYAKAIANRVVPKWMGPSGVDTPFQSAIWQNNLTYFNPGAAAGVWTGTVGANLGTAAIVLPTTTNFYTNQRRSRFASVVTTLNQQVGTRTEAMFFRGASTGQGGFFFAARVGTDTWTANDRLFVGFSTSTTALCTSDPTIRTSTIGFAVNSGSTSISFITNDATGLASVSPISNQPALASNQGYAFYIFAKPNDTVVYWQLDDINTGLKLQEGSVNTDLPANTQMLVAHACMSNASNTLVNAAQIGVNRIYIETDR